MEFALYSVIIHHRIQFNLKDADVRDFSRLPGRHIICYGRGLLLKIQILKIMNWKLQGWPLLLGTCDPARMSPFFQRNSETAVIFLKYLFIHTSCTKKVICKNQHISFKYFFWWSGNRFTHITMLTEQPARVNKNENLLMWS